MRGVIAGVTTLSLVVLFLFLFTTKEGLNSNHVSTQSSQSSHVHADTSISDDTVKRLEKALAATDAQVQTLVKNNNALTAEVARLKKTAASFEAYKKVEWILSIEDFDYWREYSQTYADGIIQYIFQNIGYTNKYYVEFGTENGDQTNTRFLREKLGWKGLLMDGGHDNPSINLHKEMMNKNNINELFKKYNVPKEFDILSVDLDYNSYWVFRAIDHVAYRPRLLIVEYMGDKMYSWEDDPIAVEDKPDTMWDGGSNYYGGNLRAMYDLAVYKGYRMIYNDRDRLNAFFLREDLIPEEGLEFIRWERVFKWGRQKVFREDTERKWLKVSPPADGAWTRNAA